MKRYLRYLALISALALVLAACGDGEGGDTTTTAGEATTTAGDSDHHRRRGDDYICRRRDDDQRRGDSLHSRQGLFRHR